MRVNINQLIKLCCTRTDPAAETKSIGLPADLPAGRQARWCLARPNDRNESASWTFYSFGRAGKKHGTAIRRLAERQLN